MVGGNVNIDARDGVCRALTRAPARVELEVDRLIIGLGLECHQLVKWLPLIHSRKRALRTRRSTALHTFFLAGACSLARTVDSMILHLPLPEPICIASRPTHGIVRPHLAFTPRSIRPIFQTSASARGSPVTRSLSARRVCREPSWSATIRVAICVL